MSETYREMSRHDRDKATIVALEKENFQLQWKLIQMGQLCQRLGGRPKDAYKKRRNWGQVVYLSRIMAGIVMLIAGTLLLLRLFVEYMNVTGCAG